MSQLERFKRVLALTPSVCTLALGFLASPIEAAPQVFETVKLVVSPTVDDILFQDLPRTTG